METENTKRHPVKWYLEMHRELWTWLAENPMADKEHWTGWEEYGLDHREFWQNCFMCQLLVDYDEIAENNRYETPSGRTHIGSLNCENCLLNWGFENDVHKTCHVFSFSKFVEGLFYRWESEFTNDELLTPLALKIAHLEIKENSVFLPIIKQQKENQDV